MIVPICLWAGASCAFAALPIDARSKWIFSVLIGAMALGMVIP